MMNTGSSSTSVTIPSTTVSQFNVQEIIGDFETSIISTPISFSFLMRTGNSDITLTPGMTMSQIQIAIIAAGVTISATNYITLLPDQRPLVVIGLAKDLPVLGPLLGLEAPESCISGNSFSYPINGLVFPLPMAIDSETPLLSISMNTQTVVANTKPNFWNTNNRYNAIDQPITTITVGVMSPYGFPLSLLTNVVVVLKLN